MVWLLIGYMFLYIHRPFEVWPFLGDLRVEFVYVLITGVLWLGGQKRLTFHPLNIAWGIFFLSVVVCCALSPWSDESVLTLDQYYKYFVFYLMLVTAVQNEADLKRIILAFVLIYGVYMLHSLWEFHCGRYVVRMGIIRMVGVDASADPNAFAASLVLALVFVPALWRHYHSRQIRALLVGFMVLAALCVNLTGSRGGFLMLLIWITVTIWNTPWRKRLAVVAIASAPLLFFALPEQLQSRFESIVDPEAGNKYAQASADVRTEGLMLGLSLWQQNPLTGIGPGTWKVATGRALKAHNLLGQLVGEMGTLGLLSFCGILVVFVVTVIRVRRVYREHPEWGRDFIHDLVGCLALGLFQLVFSGTFGHNLFRYTWIWYAAFLVIAAECVRKRLAEGWTPAIEEPVEVEAEWLSGAA